MEYQMLDYRNIFAFLKINRTLKNTKYKHLIEYEDFLLKFVDFKKGSLFESISFENSCDYMETIIALGSIGGVDISLLTSEIMNNVINYPYYNCTLAERVYDLYSILYPKQLSHKGFVSYILSFDRLINDIRVSYQKNRSIKINYQPYDDLVDVIYELIYQYGEDILYDDVSTIVISYAYLKQDYELLRRYFSNQSRYIDKILMNGYIVKTSEHKGLYFDYHSKLLFNSLDLIIVNDKVIVK